MEQTFTIITGCKSADNLFRIERLGTYNAERARGIVHTETWKEYMIKEQEWFDIRQEQCLTIDE